MTRDATGGQNSPTLPGCDWDSAYAGLVTALGTERFPSALRRLIELGCAFNSMVITRYEGMAAPRALYHDLDDVQAAISVEFYASGPYLLDPLYQACRDGVAPGAYRLFALASESFFRSEYYRTFFRKIRISDELGLLIRHAADSWIIISLARGPRLPRFSEADAANVNAMFQTVSAAVRANWGVRDEGADDAGAAILEDRLDSFGADLLSPREAEIVRLVLQGHSTPSAAAFLGISQGTVKVHRHNAYSKLGVSSQAELFSLATRHFMASRE